MNPQIASDLPKGTALLSDVISESLNVRKAIRKILERLKKDELESANGLSILHLKNSSLLAYLLNLSYLTLLKLSGKPIQDSSAVENLVELRVVLERIRPIEDKIKYQIEKYLKAGTNESGNSEEFATLKSSIDVMEDGESEEEEEKSDSKKEKIYKPPKIIQTHYPEEEMKKDKRLMRERSRALNSAMLRDALYEHTDDPEVIHNNDIFKAKAIEKRKEIERYEEAHFTRISLTKKDKASLKKMATSGNLAGELLSFRSLDAMEGLPISKQPKKRKQKKGKDRKGSKKRKYR